MGLVGVQQGFQWALDNNAYQGRVDSMPDIFDAAAADLNRTAVDADVVRAVWERMLPGAKGVALRHTGQGWRVCSGDGGGEAIEPLQLRGVGVLGKLNCWV